MTTGFVFLWVLSLSYFYCLPLLRTGVLFGVTASEVRLYDLVFLALFFYLLLPNLSQFFRYWKNLSKAHQYLYYWVIIAFLGLLLLGILRGDRFLVAFIRYIRFFSFSCAFILIYLFIDNRRQLWFLFNSVGISIVIISVIGSMQGWGLLPNLWPDYYAAYWQSDGGYLSTATLAPNHTHYSLVMAIGIIMVLTSLKLNPRFSILNLFYVAGLVPMIYSMIVSQGRSGWLVLGIYFMYTVLFSKGKILTVALLVTSVLVVLTYFSTTGSTTSVTDILLYRAINTHKDVGRTSLDFFEEEDKNFIERVDDNRWAIYESAVENLIDNPEYWIFGAGFQNASRALGGVALAAHNAYLNIFAEHGIVGLIIYSLFIFYLFKLGLRFRNQSESRACHIFGNEWMGLFFGLLAANFFGEIIYPGRALFTFLGTFFIITGLFLHPKWQNQITHERQA